MTERKAEYQKHLASAYWKRVREAAIERDGGCRACMSQKNLAVHHRRYENLGKELDHLDDVTVFCSSCHFAFHRLFKTTKTGKRAKRSRGGRYSRKKKAARKRSVK